MIQCFLGQVLVVDIDRGILKEVVPVTKKLDETIIAKLL